MSRYCVGDKCKEAYGDIIIYLMGSDYLCPLCFAFYGSNREEWPKWLYYAVNDMLREYRSNIRYERNTVPLDELIE